ncbi:hypothetical protein M422DRAFT_259286 [Sphaerobolus stellatus SS14]|uniref:Uncharacterized protein n=1 Tax=Sphaerobolus stellatus (strain SS14) TaxID=990650 RepID=A0A0C9U570_SPHS4|nr:hypothetical protein M422DRAFT_259286 [Sphaerobolus stellatus SS14]
MPFNLLQLEALEKARKILEEAGLLNSPPSSPHAEVTRFKQLLDFSQDSVHETSSPSTIKYIAPPAAPYTSEDIYFGRNRTTIKAEAQKFIRHPKNGIVEYPETGSFQGEAVVHIFPLQLGASKEDFDPKLNIQYGIWGKHGSQPNTRLFLFPQENESFTLCNQFKAECMAVKKCSYSGRPAYDVSNLGMEQISPFVDSAEREVFMKTLGFFCSLLQNGCLFNPEIDQCDSDDEAEDDDYDGIFEDTGHGSESPSVLYEVLCDIRSIKQDVPRCKGKLVFRKDNFGHSFIQCEKRRKGHQAHLIIRNLNEFNLEYLHALFEDNLPIILEFEKQAAAAGYGPLFPCSFVSSTREQKELCLNFHRTADGILKRGQLVQSEPCSARFEIYYPNDTSLNPWIAMVCRNPHSHSDPRATRTPRAIEELFNSLLNTLGWKLADATPRKIILDAAFMTRLRNILGWAGLRDPSLSDLHPSLGNFDHTARLINKLRLEQFPHGTGFQGILAMIEANASLPSDEVYVRCAEKHDIPGEKSFSLIICMFKRMSELLLQFEIEAWFPKYSRSIVVARAFTTSQSAAAHQILFRRIFEIVEADTGQQVQFRHIHGAGWDTIIADEHRGQALGLGLYLQEICRNMAGYCSVEWTKPLHELKPYDHTKRCLRICFQHYSTRVRSLKPHVSTVIYGAMMSLYSAEPISDYKATLSLIQHGGKKAADWLKNKLSADKSILAAVYHPESKIPLEVWKASPNMTNGNEQSHRNIYRDGIRMSLVPGAMRSFQFDSRSMVTLELFQEHGIYPQDRLPTYHLRASRAVSRTKKVQERTVQANDNELKKTYTQMSKLQDKVLTQTNSLKRTYVAGKDTEAAVKRVRATEKQLEGLRACVSSLQDQSSGTVPIPECLNVHPSQPEQMQANGGPSKPNINSGIEQRILQAPAHLPSHVNQHDYQTIQHIPSNSQTRLPQPLQPPPPSIPLYHTPQYDYANSIQHSYLSPLATVPLPAPYISQNSVVHVHPWMPPNQQRDSYGRENGPPNVPVAYPNLHSPWIQNPYSYPCPYPPPNPSYM